MLNIVNTEQHRLQDKKSSIDNAITGQKRMIELNNSNRLRQQSYTKILVIFIIVLVLFVGIIMLSKALPFIPQVVFELLSIIIISIGIYMALYTYLDIQSRNNMNFDELDIPGLNNTALGNTIATGKGSGSLSNLLYGTNLCVENECCGPETVWDMPTNKCVPISTTTPMTTTQQNFTTMTTAYINGDLSNGPYEFESYTPV
jgi:hypothetical protein